MTTVHVELEQELLNSYVTKSQRYFEILRTIHGGREMFKALCQEAEDIRKEAEMARHAVWESFGNRIKQLHDEPTSELLNSFYDTERGAL